MMPDDDLRTRADERFQEALRAAGARDPREFYRGQLRLLKERDPQAYRRATAYYEEKLIPAVAREGSDPLAEWLEYGRQVAAAAAPGRTVQIDPDGLARDYAPPVPPDALVLHLPDSGTHPALVVGLPAGRLSAAQRAAYELLVNQSQGG